MFSSVFMPSFGVATCRALSFLSQKAARRRKSSSARAGIFCAHGRAGIRTALAEQEQELRLLAGSEGQALHEHGAVVAAVFKAAGALAALERDGVALGAVRAEESIPQAVEAVGREIGGEELVAVFFIVQLIVDDAIHIAAARRVEAHLKVAVVHVDLVEAELRVGKNRKPARTPTVVAEQDVPELDGIVHRDEERLFGVDLAVVAAIVHVAEAVAAGIARLVPADGLPRDRPEFAALIVAEVDIVARAVHRDAVWPEARDAVIFRRAAEQIAARGVVEYAVHVPLADVVRPGDGKINPVDHVFAAFVVKMSILHPYIPPSSWLCFYYSGCGRKYIGLGMRLFAARCAAPVQGRAGLFLRTVPKRCHKCRKAGVYQTGVASVSY